MPTVIFSPSPSFFTEDQLMFLTPTLSPLQSTKEEEESFSSFPKPSPPSTHPSHHTPKDKFTNRVKASHRTKLNRSVNFTQTQGRTANTTPETRNSPMTRAHSLTSLTSPVDNSTPPILTPTGSKDPTQPSETTSKSSAPIIGGVIGGTIVVALIALTAVMIVKRRCGRKQGGPVPTINPLLDDPHITEFAAQRGEHPFGLRLILSSLTLDIDLPGKGPRPFLNHKISSVNGSSSQIQTQSQSQSTLGRSSSLPPSLRDFESAMQRHMEMMESVSQRLNLMSLGLEAQQREHQDRDGEPPDYESRVSM